MPLVTAYHRPSSLEQALSLLADQHRIPLAGGTVVNADRQPSALEVVDLQALGLDAIADEGRRVHLGATARLADLVDDDRVPPLVRRMARSELPSTLRTLATVGGTVAVADRDSVLLAALLVHDGEAVLARGGTMPLSVLVAVGVPPGDLVTGVTVERSGETADAATGRTPADVPIVAALARRAEDGIRLALTGVAGRPVLADPAAPTADLTPPDDFRGSTTYRLELARILAGRVLEQLA